MLVQIVVERVAVLLEQIQIRGDAGVADHPVDIAKRLDVRVDANKAEKRHEPALPHAPIRLYAPSPGSRLADHDRIAVLTGGLHELRGARREKGARVEQIHPPPVHVLVTRIERHEIGAAPVGHVAPDHGHVAQAVAHANRLDHPFPRQPVRLGPVSGQRTAEAVPQAQKDRPAQLRQSPAEDIDFHVQFAEGHLLRVRLTVVGHAQTDLGDDQERVRIDRLAHEKDPVLAQGHQVEVGGVEHRRGAIQLVPVIGEVVPVGAGPVQNAVAARLQPLQKVVPAGEPAQFIGSGTQIGRGAAAQDEDENDEKTRNHR